MDTLVLICFAVLAALVVGGVVVLDRRLAGLSARLESLDELERLAERVRGLSSKLNRKEFNQQLASRLTEVGEAQRRTSAALVELQGQLSEWRRDLARREHAASARPAESLPDRVRRHLAGQGYREVRLINDPDQLEGRSGRVIFEARREGALQKGHVSLGAGEIVDVQVRSAHVAFP